MKHTEPTPIMRDLVNPYVFAGLPIDHQFAYRKGTLKTDAQIIRLVTERFNLKFGDLITQSRERDIVIPRQILMFFMKKTHKSLKEIGRMFNRDHSTVIYSLRCIEDMMTYDNDVRFHVLELMKVI